MEAAGSTHAPPGATRDRAPKRRPAPGPLLRLASDERLVARVRAGSEAAFAVLWERYHRQLLSYCRHMLGSHHEAEDAVQQVFANAYRDMLRGDRALRVRPWLYRIARNQCISALRSQRPLDELDDQEPATAGLSDELEGRSDLRELLRDMAALPAAQREALLLAELHDNSHAEVAEIVGCDREKVKSLVFQARASLISARQAREASCEEIQRQLSVLRGGSLRRGVLRRHLAGCEACRLFHTEVKRQRAALAVVLPVTPVGVLKLGAAGALAASGGAAAGGAAAGGGAAVGSGAAAGSAAGSAATLAAKLGVSTALVKSTAATVAVTTVVAGGAATVQVARDTPSPTRPAVEQTSGDAGPERPGARPPGVAGAAAPAFVRRALARKRVLQRARRARMHHVGTRRSALARDGRIRLQRRRSAARAEAPGKQRTRAGEPRRRTEPKQRDAREPPARERPVRERPRRERPRSPERQRPPRAVAPPPTYPVEPAPAPVP